MGRLAWFITGLGLCFLYVTGVMHWLYRHGKIKDQAVNIAALRPLAERAEQLFYRLAVVLLTFSVLAARWMMPHIKTGYGMLGRWFERRISQLR